MKKIYSIAAGVLLTASVFAQTPQKMSYQAVIRNNSGQLVSNQPIGMQISILQGSSTGSAVYVETQTPNSNANGLVSLEIGAGTVVAGTFATINWDSGPYFIKTETDPAGGTSYNITSTSQLLSVPFALLAEKSKSTDCTTCDTRFLNANTSDAMAGTLTVNEVNYSPAKTFTTYISENDFVPRQDGATVGRGYGSGGAHITNGQNGGLVAAINLPRGATILEVKFYFLDVDAVNNLRFVFSKFLFNGYSTIGNEYSNGSSGYGSVTLSSGLPSTYTGDYVYYVLVLAVNAANSTIAWPSPSTNMMVGGVRVVYSTTTAQ